MKKEILVIAGLWLLSNIIFYYLYGTGGAVASTYICGAIVWFGRKKLIRLLNI